MSEKLKERLVKQISLYNDHKKNLKYLIYFSGNNGCIKMLATNGTDVWCRLLSDEKFLADLILKEHLSASFKLDDLYSCLNAALNESKFEVNGLIDFTESDCDDLVEFRVEQVEHNGKKYSFKFPMDTAKSNANELKSLLFYMYDRLGKCEDELRKAGLGSKSSANSLVDNHSSDSGGKNQSSDAEQGLRRFSMQSSQSAACAANRKAGMSIINPNSKRRKMPKGVKFDEEEDDDEDSNSSAASPKKQLLRNNSSQSDF